MSLAPLCAAARRGARAQGGVRRGLHRRRGQARGRRARGRATSCCSRTCASIPARRRTIRHSPISWPRSATLYVNDAFSAAHRAHASITGLAERLPAAAGRLMQAEIEALTRALDDPERPLAALVGGAKVSTKLEVLGNLIEQGRPAGHRRRHGQHLPVRPGHAGGQIPVRAGHGRHRARDHGQGGGAGAASCCCRSMAGSRASFEAGAPSEVVPIERCPKTR